MELYVKIGLAKHISNEFFKRESRQQPLHLAG